MVERNVSEDLISIGNFPVEKKRNGELIWSTFCYSLPYLISFQVQNVKYGKNTEKGRKNIQVWYGVAQTQVSDQRNHHYMLYTSTSQG